LLTISRDAELANFLRRHSATRDLVRKSMINSANPTARVPTPAK
jgi:hypothetical protein